MKQDMIYYINKLLKILNIKNSNKKLGFFKYFTFSLIFLLKKKI